MNTMINTCRVYLEISKSFEQYYLVRFFTGEKSYHWGADLFEENSPKGLDK
jgi:hypothetical protein